MEDEVGVGVKAVDRWRNGGVWASGWRWAASGPGNSRTEASCRPPTEKRNPHDEHWQTLI